MMCEVCFEPIGAAGNPRRRFEWPKLTTGNGDVLREKDCNHHICCTCMGTYAATRVEEQRVFGIRCPHLGCKNELYPQDIQRLRQEGSLSKPVEERFVELRARDYTARVKELHAIAETETSPDEISFLRQLYDCRLCPRCNVLLQRSYGCNSFHCVCGHRFSYDSAPRAVGDGIKHYGKALGVAQELRISVRRAVDACGENVALYHNLGSSARLLMAQLGVSAEEAIALQTRAQLGDEEARATIRRGRAAKL